MAVRPRSTLCVGARTLTMLDTDTQHAVGVRLFLETVLSLDVDDLSITLICKVRKVI